MAIYFRQSNETYGGLELKGKTFDPIASKFGFSRQIIITNYTEIRQPGVALVVDKETDMT